MNISERKYFDDLKVKIVNAMQQSHPEIPDSIEEWKGQHIIDFQENLRFTQNEHISEKWFYTHMKTTNSRLPRIDILNFLSKYVGYKNWDDYKLKNELPNNEIPGDKSNRVFLIVPFIMLVALFVFFLIFKSMYTQEYTFCFYDNDTKEAIENTIIEISVVTKDESPVNYLCNNQGCFSLKTNKRILEFIVETPYYRTDTIVRVLNKFNRTENVKLKLDDYAVMIHYFSKSNVNEWQKRRDDLDQMISDSVKIYQVLNGTIGMQMYNKWEFINKLTLPTNSLQHIEVLDTKYEGEKITHLRFKQLDRQE